MLRCAGILKIKFICQLRLVTRPGISLFLLVVLWNFDHLEKVNVRETCLGHSQVALILTYLK